MHVLSTEDLLASVPEDIASGYAGLRGRIQQVTAWQWGWSGQHDVKSMCQEQCAFQVWSMAPSCMCHPQRTC